MVDVITKMRIAVPKQEVVKYAADPDHAPSWYKNIKSVEWKTPKPMAVGSLIAFKAHFMGKQLSYTYKIEKYIAGEELVMNTSEGPFPMQTTYKWEAVDDNACVMTLRNCGHPTGFSKLFAPFMQMAMRAANKKDLKKLKSILENKLN